MEISHVLDVLEIRTLTSSLATADKILGAKASH